MLAGNSKFFSLFFHYAYRADPYLGQNSFLLNLTHAGDIIYIEYLYSVAYLLHLSDYPEVGA